MTNINPSKIILKVRTAMWYLFFQTIGIWLLSSCEQKDLCYDHNHASNVKVTFNWEQYPNANPASMCFYLFPREEGERTLKREFIGKNGGIAQALVGVSYTALGFNSDARNTSFRYNISTNSIEASSKDAGAIDRIGISASLLPRAKGTEGERMSMEADSIYSSASEKDILISLEENDRGDTCKITLSPKRRFCTYRLKIMNIDNQQNLSSSIAGSISDLAGGINLSTGEKTAAKVTIPFAVGTIANDFTYITREGTTGTLKSIKANYTLIYFNNPDCHDCKRVYNILAGDSPTLAHLVARGELAILALYPDESLTSWNKNKGIYPYNWIVARYARDIDREKYNIPAIPSTYLLDKNKKVIYKDAIIEAVESYLRHKYKL